MLMVTVQYLCDAAAIAAAAEKYGGSAQASNSGTEFYVDVVLKI